MGSRVGLRRRAAIALTLIGCFVAAAMPPALSQQDRLDEIERKKDRLDRKDDRLGNREQDLYAKILVLDRARAKVERKVDRLSAEIADLDRRIDSTKKELTEKQQLLTLRTEELMLVQARLVHRTNLFTERAIAAYKAGPTAYLDGILSSDDFGELVDRYAYYESALDADARLVEEIETLRTESEFRRDLVEDAKNEIAERKLALEADRDVIAEKRADKAEVLEQRKAVVAAKSDILSGVKRHRAQIAAIEARLERESNRLAALLSSGYPTGGGQLAWPAVGPVVSGYGYRTHPIFGDSRLHTGIDIGAGYGAPVVAADGGVVVYVGAIGGYGNVVVIDHGNGLGTTYNHLSAFGVSDGESVGRRQYVGAVGCTGYCTGPHLHFEVRVNGTPVDPMPYLQ